MCIFFGKVAPAADTGAIGFCGGLKIGDSIGDIVSRREIAAIGAQDDNLDAFIADRAVKRGIDVVNHLRVDCIMLVRASQRNAGYALGWAFVTDIGFGH